MGSRGPSLVPFGGQPPLVTEGGAVWVRDAGGEWHLCTARSKARYDTANALGGRCYLTVAVSQPDDHRWVNWPAEDVRTTPPENVRADGR